MPWVDVRLTINRGNLWVVLGGWQRRNELRVRVHGFFGTRGAGTRHSLKATVKSLKTAFDDNYSVNNMLKWLK